MSDLEDAFGEQPGVVAVTYHSKEESFRTYQLLTEGSAWAQDIPDDAIPAELTIEFDLGATGVPDAIETARAARGVREVSTGGVMADPGAIGAFRAAVVEACPGIELWPRLPT